MTAGSAVAAAVGLPGPVAGWTVFAFETVASTMAEARRLVADGVPERTAVRTERQMAGRGRLGRPWASPGGNVYTTVIVRPDVPTARASELSLVSAVAAADAVAAFAEPVRLKWPNDVLLDGGKVAGVLLEAIAEGHHLSAVLIGIGINVASCPNLPDRATARLEGAESDAVFAALLEALDRRYRQWERDGLAGILLAWRERGPELGTPISVGHGSERLHGGFAGLEFDGALRLALTDGSIRRIASGEILE